MIHRQQVFHLLISRLVLSSNDLLHNISKALNQLCLNLR